MSSKSGYDLRLLRRGISVPRSSGTDRGLMFVIFSTGRSGTSAVAGCMHLMGIRMGINLIRPDDKNARGYFEDTEIVKLNARIIDEAGGETILANADDICKLKNTFRQDVKALMANRRGIVWGFKDPRTQVTYRVLQDLLEADNDPLYVFVERPKEEVVASLIKAYETKEEVAERWYDLRKSRVDYWQDALPTEKQISVSYPNLLQDPQDFVTAIADRLNLDSTERQRGISVVKRFLEPSLKHF